MQSTTEIYTLSLHDALPISNCKRKGRGRPANRRARKEAGEALCRFLQQLATSNSENAFTRAASRYRKEVDRKSTRLNSSHTVISYAVFCLKKKKKKKNIHYR